MAPHVQGRGGHCGSGSLSLSLPLDLLAIAGTAYRGAELERDAGFWSEFAGSHPSGLNINPRTAGPGPMQTASRAEQASHGYRGVNDHPSVILPAQSLLSQRVLVMQGARVDPVPRVQNLFHFREYPSGQGQPTKFPNCLYHHLPHPELSNPSFSSKETPSPAQPFSKEPMGLQLTSH